VVLSGASAKSQNVLDEVSYAIDEERSVLPILLQPCNIPFRIKRLQYIDFTTDFAAGFTQLAIALDSLPQPGSGNETAAQVAQQQPGAQTLSTITARTLVVHGDCDPFFPADIAVSLYRSIPDAALWIIPGGDHAPIYDPAFHSARQPSDSLIGQTASSNHRHSTVLHLAAVPRGGW
jgi:pimeloyl-ACP methyl ester carboxylesterase